MDKATEQAPTKRIEDLTLEADQAAAVKGGGVIVEDCRKAGEKPLEY